VLLPTIRRSCLAGVVLLLGAAAGWAFSTDGAREDATTRATDLTGGTPAESQRIATLYLSSGCTGVMIGPNQLLTAAHRVTSKSGTNLTTHLISGYNKGDDIRVSNNSAISLFGTWFSTTVTATDLPPDYVSACTPSCPSTSAAPYPEDVAIVTLDATFPRYFGPPARVGTRRVMPGDAVIEGGFGCTTGFQNPDPNPTQYKQATGTVVDRTGPMPAIFKQVTWAAVAIRTGDTAPAGSTLAGGSFTVTSVFGDLGDTGAVRFSSTRGDSGAGRTTSFSRASCRT
jgi:hypothetical protein